MEQDDIKARIARSNAIGMGLIKPSDKLEEAGQEPKPEEQGLLLTDEQIKGISGGISCRSYDRDIHLGRHTAQVQLAKAEPLIRKNERKRIIKEVEATLGIKNDFGDVHTEYCSWDKWQAIERGEL